jgi:hypothetical protein
MGMRKKWSRPITVDGVRYRYHVAEDHFDGCGLNICVERVEPAGQRLMSGFRKPLAWTEVEPGHRVSRVISHAVTPRVVRQLILAALARGWRPAESGLGAFHLPGAQVVPELPAPAAEPPGGGPIAGS